MSDAWLVWYFKNPTPFRPCPSSTTSQSACAWAESVSQRNCANAWNALCVWPRSGMRSRIGLTNRQQLLCIARALAVEPDVLLMDEPASALDPISTMRIEELVEQLKADYTVVIVTHNMQQAARIADRTAFFLNGELIEFGETSTLFTKPHDKRTEDYITGRFG